MVIINYKGGQLANRIIFFAQFIVNSIENDYDLVNFEFDEYEPYFNISGKKHLCSNCVGLKKYDNYFINYLYRRITRLWTDITHRFFTESKSYKVYRIYKSHDNKNIEFDLNNTEFVKNAVSKTVFVQGWSFRDKKNFIKYADQVRLFFQPVEKYRKEVGLLMDGIRKTADIVIGIHIRRGDYIRYNSGRYYYTDEVYADKMMQLFKYYTQRGKSCTFLICSNEPVSVDNFPKELNMDTGERNFIVDLYSLAACNAIVGPPSTFSGWASFYGKVPYMHIETKEDVVVLKDYIKYF
jgi:hypothetical protein